MVALFLYALALAADRTARTPFAKTNRWIAPARRRQPRSGALLPRASRGDDLSSSVDAAAAAAAPAERRPAGADDAAAAPPAEALARDRERAPLEGDSRVTTLEKSTDVGAPQIKVEKQIGIEDMLRGAPRLFES